MPNGLRCSIDDIEMTPLESPVGIQQHDGLYATHRGVVDLLGFELEVFQLSNGERVISEESMLKTLGFVKACPTCDGMGVVEAVSHA